MWLPRCSRVAITAEMQPRSGTEASGRIVMPLPVDFSSRNKQALYGLQYVGSKRDNGPDTSVYRVDTLLPGADHGAGCIQSRSCAYTLYGEAEYGR